MLIARLMLVVALCVGIAAVGLFFITGNRAYLRFLWRSSMVILLLGGILLLGMLLARMVGVLL